MVGINLFRDYFRDYTDQYVLIGGAACDISFGSNDVDFRATKDLDIVLIVEALTVEFAERFWEFIKSGRLKEFEPIHRTTIDTATIRARKRGYKL